MAHSHAHVCGHRCACYAPRETLCVSCTLVYRRDSIATLEEQSQFWHARWPETPFPARLFNQREVTE
jgi:hypothetical protein